MGLLKTRTVITKPLTKENILNSVTSLQIFEYYLSKRLNIPSTILSPFRKEHKPSFALYGKNADNIYYADKTTGCKGNSIDFVMQLFEITFFEALVKINIDFNCKLLYDSTKYNVDPTKRIIPKKKEVTSVRKIITIQSHKDTNNNPTFTPSDMKYWSRYSITKTTLTKHNVFSVKDAYLDGNQFMTYVNNNPIFAYLYFYKDSYYYKTYRPLTTDKAFKFYNDFHGVSKYLIHGVKLLPPKGNNLIITKSAKDCMVLDTIGINSIAVQSEGISILPHHMEWFRKRWNNIYILYDNDYNKEQNWGQLHAQKVVNEYPFLQNIQIPDEYTSTDISDMVAKYSTNATSKLINELIQ